MDPQDRSHSLQDEDRLLQYLDGQLPAPDAGAVEAHLAVCPECQALRRQWEQLDEKLTRTLAQPRLSPDFAARFGAGCGGGEGQRAGRPGRGRRGAVGPNAPNLGSRPGDAETRVLWFGLLDGLGYGAVAAVGGYWLYHLAVAWGPSPAGAGTAFLRGPAFLFALAVAARRSVGRFEPGCQEQGMALAGGALRLRLAGLRLGNAQCRGSRAGQGVAIARNPWSRFPDVCDPDHRPQALRKGGQSVESAAKLRLGLAPSPVAALSVDTPGLAQVGSPKRPAFGPHPPPTPLPIPADRAAAPPEPPGAST